MSTKCLSSPQIEITSPSWSREFDLMCFLRCLFHDFDFHHSFWVLFSVQWRIRCREDGQHKTCHPVFCNNCIIWRIKQERASCRQNEGSVFLIVLFNNRQSETKGSSVLFCKLTFLNYSWITFSGESGGSNHPGEPSAGSFRECQDCEKWQLLTICEFKFVLYGSTKGPFPLNIILTINFLIMFSFVVM